MTISRRMALQLGGAAAGLVALGTAVPYVVRAALRQPTRLAGTGGGGMMGAATTSDMSSYMDLFNHHNQIQRTVEEVPGGVRTTTESGDPALAARLQTHVSSMYGHLQRAEEVQCMSNSLPLLFRNASGYQRQLVTTTKGLVVTEISSDPRVTEAIRAHAREVSGFVEEGMPAMMQGMMGESRSTG